MYSTKEYTRKDHTQDIHIQKIKNVKNEVNSLAETLNM